MARVRVDLPQDFDYSTELQIRVSDLNYGAHLGNDAVLSLVHEARMRFFRSLGFDELNIDGVGILIADAAIEYRAEGFYGEWLLVSLAVQEIGRKGCDLVYRLVNRDTGTEVARVKTGVVFFDHGAKKVVRIPPAFLGRLGRSEG
jgi:4-hydroxybenzoyl-CoA thioesterase